MTATAEINPPAKAPTRPVLRYHGGKWRIAPWIISHFPAHKIYVEPFGGGASVLIRKPRSFSEVYNDLDADVVNTFRVLRDRDMAFELCRQLELTPFSRDEFNSAYAISEDPVESARRFIARSFMGFGSSGNRVCITGFRAASKQSWRPHAMDWVNVPDSLACVVERLKGVVIENKCGLEVIKQQDSDETLFYVDPPYLLGTRNCHVAQYRFEMSATDHVCLARTLSQIKGKAIVSGYPDPLYEELYPGWYRVERKTRKSSNVGSVESTEVLWMNFDPDPLWKPHES